MLSNKIKKLSKIKRGYKTLISNFAYFLTAVAKSIISRREGLSPPKFEVFLIFPNFPKSEVLTYLATCEPTPLPNLLYEISRLALLTANRICTKTVVITTARLH